MHSTDDQANSPLDGNLDDSGTILEPNQVSYQNTESAQSSIQAALMQLRRFIESGMPEETIDLVEGELASVLGEEDKYVAIAEAYETQAKFFQASAEQWRAIPASDPLRKYVMSLIAENDEIANVAFEKAKEYKRFADMAKQQH